MAICPKCPKILSDVLAQWFKVYLTGFFLREIAILGSFHTLITVSYELILQSLIVAVMTATQFKISQL